MATAPSLPSGYSFDNEPRPYSGMIGANNPSRRRSVVPIGDARTAALSVYPGLNITDWARDPNSSLGQASPGSFHVRTRAAIDSRPLPGMNFNEYLDGYRRQGYPIIEARDEVTNPSGHATGPHWHAVLGERIPLPAGFSFSDDGADARGPQAAPEDATAYAQALHDDQAAQLSRRDDIEARAAITRAIAARVPRPQPATITRDMMPMGNEANFNNGGAVYHGNDPQGMATILGQLEAASDRGASEADLIGLAQSLRVLTPEMRQQIATHVRERDADPDRVRPFNAFVPDSTRAAPQRRDDLPTPGPNATPAEVEAWNRERIARANPEGAAITPHRPGLTERLGQGYGSAAGLVVGEREGVRFGRRVDDLLSNPFSPFQAVEDAGTYNERAMRARMEGRELDALGNELGAGIATLGIIPIVGRARGATEVAGRALEEFAALAGRIGVDDVARLSDDQLSALVCQNFADLPEDVRAFITGNPLDAGTAPSMIDIAAIRQAATPGPSLLSRGVAAVRNRFRGRGATDETVEAAPGSARTAAMANEAPRGPELVGPVMGAERVRDRIDVNDLPPLPPGFQLEPQIGRIAPLGEQPSPTDLADVARSIRPEDVTPVNNTIEGIDEAARANPGTIRDVPAINPRNELEMRSVPDPRWPGRTVRHRGPLDAEAFIRARGGLRDDGGDLMHMGVTSAPRAGTGDRNLGPLLSRNGMTLDEAGEALFEAGYVAERPTTAEVLDILDAGRRGQRTFHPDDWAEVERFEGATEQRMLAERAADEGRPLGEQVGEPIGPDDLPDVPATAYEELSRVGGRVGNINLANVESEEDIRRLLQNVEDRFGGFDAARRGSITHAETRALADELGMTADDLLRRRRGQALNAEQALAARQLLAKSSDEVIALAARATGPEASNVSRAAFSEALLRHAAIHEQVSGATAEAGRALQAFRMAARSKAISGRIHQAAVDGLGGQGKLEDIAQGILDLQRQGAEVGVVNRFAVQATMPRLSDKLIELWYNWLLSGPQTHAVNVLSNMMTAVLQLPEQATAATLGNLRRGYRAMRGREDDFDRVLYSELGARAYGMAQGAGEGLRAFGKTFLTGEVTDFVTKVESRSQNAIGGWKGSVLRTPTRTLAAEDEFFKAVARRMEIAGLAARQGRKEGHRGAALRERIADLTANPTDEMVERALDRARYVTFQRPLTGFPQAISGLTQRNPVLKLFLPFIRTPTNIFKFALERSPAAPLLKEVRANLRAGGEARDLAIARIALGTGVGMLVGQLAANGIITGRGPADERARDLMRADGWQPYSLRIGDRYYSYQRLDPLALTLGTAADMVGISEHMTPRQAEQAGAVVISSIVSNLSNKTWLSGASDLIEAISDPGRHGERFVRRLAGSIAVPTGVAQVARTIDPTQRDVQSIGDQIQSRIPGLSDNLPARRNVFGEPVTNEGGLGPDWTSPIWTSTARNDPVARELLSIEAGISPPSRRVGGRELSPREYERYAEAAGYNIRAFLDLAIRSSEWQDMNREERQEEVDEVTRQARAEARRALGLTASRQSGGRQSGEALPPLPEGFELPPLPPGFELERY